MKTKINLSKQVLSIAGNALGAVQMRAGRLRQAVLKAAFEGMASGKTASARCEDAHHKGTYRNEGRRRVPLQGMIDEI